VQSNAGLRLGATVLVLVVVSAMAGICAIGHAQDTGRQSSDLTLQPRAQTARSGSGVVGIQIPAPQGEQSDAFMQLQAMPQAASTASWTSVGPVPISGEELLGPNGYCTPRPAISASGRATSIAFGAGGAIYFGSAGGGVWKSVNAGSTWSVLTDGQPSLAVGAIAVVPGATTAQDVVYIGTGESNQAGDNQYGQGILKSTDGGTTWTQLGLATFNYQTFGRIAVVPGTGGNPDTLYAATTTGVIGAGTANFVPPSVTVGVYKSTDGGNSWNLLSGGGGLPSAFTGVGYNGSARVGFNQNGAATDVAVDPLNPSNVYAAIVCTSGCNNGGVWRSQNAGASWQQLTSGIPTITTRMSLWLPNSTTLYVANTIDGDDFDAVYISNNVNSNSPMFRAGGSLPVVGGSTECLSTDQADYNLALGGDPANPNTVYLGLIGLYRSTDGGSTWNYTLDEAHPDFHAVSVNNGVVYALNDGGLSSSSNGVNWSALINNGLAALQFQGAALGPQGNALIAGGMQDNDLSVFTGNPIWTSSQAAGDSGITAISPAGGAVFGERQSGDLIRSTQSGAVGSFQDIGPALDNSNGERTLFYAPFSLDPSNADRMVFGTYRVWQTCAEGGTVSCNATTGGPTNGSPTTPVNWTPISPQLNPGCTMTTEDGPIQQCLISDVRIAPTNPSVMYVVTATSGDFTVGPFAWVSQNSNAATPTFSNITTGLPSGRPLTSVAISPINPALAVVSVNGFTSGGGHIFESTNYDQGWTDISTVVSGYPNLPTLKVMFDANDPTGKTILAGTSAGILRTTNNGASWQNFNTEFPLTQTFDLEQNPGFLLAATHGRGVWTYQTSTAGGAVSATEATSTGGPGETVSAGSITVNNGTANAATLRSVTVSTTEPSIFSAMTLQGGGQTVTVSPVSTGVTFNFQSPLQIAANASVTFDLSAKLTGGPSAAAATTNSWFAGGSFAECFGRPTRLGVAPVVFALVALGVILLPSPIRGRRLIPIAATVLIFGAIVMQAGCGGSSSGSGPGPVKGTSEQSATQIWLSSNGGSVAVTGVPASLGTVTSR